MKLLRFLKTIIFRFSLKLPFSESIIHAYLNFKYAKTFPLPLKFSWVMSSIRTPSAQKVHYM